MPLGFYVQINLFARFARVLYFQAFTRIFLHEFMHEYARVLCSSMFMEFVHFLCDWRY